MFPAAIGEENEGDTLGLEVGKGFVRARERVGAAGEDAIDVESECEIGGVLGDGGCLEGAAETSRVVVAC